MNKYFNLEGYTLRRLKVEDLNGYYQYGFEEADEESNYYTGTECQYTKDQIRNYLEKIEGDASRIDFIICGKDEIIGEVVINDIRDKSGHYRICIFNKKNFSKGIGYKATVGILKYAFEELGLNTIDLEVFPFNERGIGLYKKLGFEIVESIIDEEANEPYREIIVMRLFKEKFRH